MLANAVGAAAETLGGDGKVVGLILKSIETLSTLGNLVDVVAHHTDGVVDLLGTMLAIVLEHRSAAQSESAEEGLRSDCFNKDARRLDAAEAYASSSIECAEVGIKQKKARI